MPNPGPTVRDVEEVYGVSAATPAPMPSTDDSDIPSDVRRELMRCATDNGRISYYYLCDLWRRGLSAAERPAQTWQPIESAPKGAMTLFCSMNTSEVPKWCFVDWLADGHFMLHPTFDATHWMPLPAPPGHVAQEKE